MNGRPVWLVSGSLRDFFGRLIPSARWTPADTAILEATLLTALDGVGDRTRERFFRMPVTACIHRQLTADEEAGLRAEWHHAPAVHLAGGPLEILRETVPGAASTKPCRDPGRKAVPGQRDPDLFLLQDCGTCESCAARTQMDSSELATRT